MSSRVLPAINLQGPQSHTHSETAVSHFNTSIQWRELRYNPLQFLNCTPFFPIHVLPWVLAALVVAPRWNFVRNQQKAAENVAQLGISQRGGWDEVCIELRDGRGKTERQERNKQLAPERPPGHHNKHRDRQTEETHKRPYTVCTRTRIYSELRNKDEPLTCDPSITIWLQG